MQKRGHGWTTTAVRLACVLCFCAFTPSTVSAEPTQYDDLVAEYFGLFVVPAERRSSIEGIRLNEGVFEMDYHWSLKVKKDPLCTGGRWLIVGRLDGARGARAFFKKRPDIQRVRLRLLTGRLVWSPLEMVAIAKSRTPESWLDLSSRLRERENSIPTCFERPLKVSDVSAL